LINTLPKSYPEMITELDANRSQAAAKLRTSCIIITCAADIKRVLRVVTEGVCFGLSDAQTAPLPGARCRKVISIDRPGIGRVGPGSRLHIAGESRSREERKIRRR